jgi:exopolyphosphatase/guanosine-5'-triphosphate,3'-diphosphate pyrophosphatase
MGASIEVLAQYADLMAAHDVGSVACGATGVVRRAINGPRFMEDVGTRTGIRGEILSESSEAYLSAKGVLAALPRNGLGTLTFDLGGGTTEFLKVEPSADAPSWSDSVPVGASTITQRFLGEAPARDDALRQAREAIRSAIREVLGRAVRESTGTGAASRSWELVGTAGTVTTLAAIHLQMAPYVAHRVNGVPLTHGWVRELVQRLQRMSLDERRRMVGLEAGREDVILGGALIVDEILAGLGRSRLLAADAGLLEGLLMDLVEKEALGRPGLRSPLRWRLPE